MTKKIFALILFICLSIFFTVACFSLNKNDGEINETIELSQVVFNEIEFDNNNSVKLNQNSDSFEITGTIDAMSLSQKNVFCDDKTSYVIVLKIIFDKEKTLSSFAVEGKIKKVYSDDENDENYVGNLSSILDNKPWEDAYCYLILSANTKCYNLTIKYTDEHISNIKISINANLACEEKE